MKTLPISEFKSKCIAILKEAQCSGEGVIVTVRGQPLARIEPIVRQPGVFRGRMTVNGDIIHTDSAGG